MPTSCRATSPAAGSAARAGAALASAIDGATVAAHARRRDRLRRGASTTRARVGLPALLALDFQQRAARLKALAKYLDEHKEELYAISAPHRRDARRQLDRHRGRRRHAVRVRQSWAATSCPRATWCTKARRCRSARRAASPAPTSWCRARGVAVHINAFNFPVWGLLEKFAPSFLAGMPCIVKPATSTSYLTEALVRLMHRIGPAARGQPAAGDRQHRRPARPARRPRRRHLHRLGRHRRQAARASEPGAPARSPSTPRPTRSTARSSAPDVTPDDEEFDLFVKEVAREMTVKAGQKCTAIRRAIVPRQHLDAVAERLRARLAKIVVGDPSRRGRAHGRAGLARAAGATWPSASRMLAQGNELRVRRARRLRAARRGRRPTARSSRRRCCCAATRMSNDAVHDVEAFGPVSTLMPYDDFDEALALAARGRGSLVGTLVTRDPQIAAQRDPGRWRRCTAACWCSTARPRPNRPATARRCRSSSTAARAAPAAARSSAACAPSSTTCSARRCRARRRCWRPSPASTCAAPRCTRSTSHPFRKHFEDLQIGDSLLTHRRTVERGRHRRLRRHLGRLLLHALRRDRGEGVAVRQAHRARLLRAVGGGRACSSRRRRARCWPTTGSTRCASSSRWASATRSARA